MVRLVAESEPLELLNVVQFSDPVPHTTVAPLIVNAVQVTAEEPQSTELPANNVIVLEAVTVKFVAMKVAVVLLENVVQLSEPVPQETVAPFAVNPVHVTADEPHETVPPDRPIVLLPVHVRFVAVNEPLLTANVVHPTVAVPHVTVALLMVIAPLVNPDEPNATVPLVLIVTAPAPVIVRLSNVQAPVPVIETLPAVMADVPSVVVPADSENAPVTVTALLFVLSVPFD
jgi:hypothetical protein